MLGTDTFESFALMPEGSFLRIGPWSHGVNTFDKPEINYSKVECAAVTEDMENEFLRSALEGRASETAKLPGKMQIFVMGANVWRYENEWPLKRTVYRKLYFGEGRALSFDAPKGAPGEIWQLHVVGMKEDCKLRLGAGTAGVLAELDLLNAYNRLRGFCLAICSD